MPREIVKVHESELPYLSTLAERAREIVATSLGKNPKDLPRLVIEDVWEDTGDSEGGVVYHKSKGVDGSPPPASLHISTTVIGEKAEELLDIRVINDVTSAKRLAVGAVAIAVLFEEQVASGNLQDKDLFDATLEYCTNEFSRLLGLGRIIFPD